MGKGASARVVWRVQSREERTYIYLVPSLGTSSRTIRIDTVLNEEQGKTVPCIIERGG